MTLNIQTITEMFTMVKSYLKSSDTESFAMEFLEYLAAHNYNIHHLLGEDPDLDKAIKKIDEYMKEEEDLEEYYDEYSDEEDF